MELRHLLNLSNFELFDFDYPFDDKAFASELEEHIIDYYYFHEIGQETPDHFKHVFRSRFKRMIGYYNELYNTTLLEYNPLINYSMTEAQEQLRLSSTVQDNEVETGTSNTSTTNSDTTRTDNTQSTTEGNTTSNSNEKMSDYPQQSIAGGDYLSGERIVTDNSDNDSTTTNTGTVKNTGSADIEDIGTTNTTGLTTTEGTDNMNYQKTIEGITGTSYQDLINKQRDGIMRLIPMIIDEMKPCFILVY